MSLETREITYYRAHLKILSDCLFQIGTEIQYKEPKISLRLKALGINVLITLKNSFPTSIYKREINCYRLDDDNKNNLIKLMKETEFTDVNEVLRFMFNTILTCK